MQTHCEVTSVRDLDGADRFEIVDGYFEDWRSGAMCLREIASETFVHTDALLALFRAYLYEGAEGIALRNL